MEFTFARLVKVSEDLQGSSRQRLRKRFEQVPPEKMAVALLRATAEENVAFSTFAVMVAVGKATDTEETTVVATAMRTGYSYHALCKLVERNPWFERVKRSASQPLTCFRLTDEGREKLDRVARRAARYV